MSCHLSSCLVCSYIDAYVTSQSYSLAAAVAATTQHWFSAGCLVHSAVCTLDRGRKMLADQHCWCMMHSLVWCWLLSAGLCLSECCVFAGQKLVRINLSEQTDMMDLLGADLPVQGGAPGQFAW